MDTKTRDDYIFKFAYSEALNDAISQKAYLGKKNNIEDIQEIKNIVREFIDSIFDDDKRMIPVKDVAVKIKEAIVNKTKTVTSNGEENTPQIIEHFSFGNIQKLINMTAKYVFISCWGDEKRKDKFNGCDCPMDRRMYEYVYKRYKSQDDYNDELLITSKNDNRDHKNFSEVSWSKIQWGTDENSPACIKIYDNYQKMVQELAEKEGISPIEFDLKYFEESRKQSEQSPRTMCEQSR